MRKTPTYTTKIAIIDHVLSEFLTPRENSLIKGRIGPFARDIDFGMRIHMDFPKHYFMIDPSYLKKNLKAVTREIIEKRNKNTYGFLAKMTYSPVVNLNSSLLYLIKTSTGRASFIAILENEIWSEAKENVLRRIEHGDGDKSIFDFLQQEVRKHYITSVDQDQNLDAAPTLDAKEEKQIIDIFADESRLADIDKLVDHLFQQALPVSNTPKETKEENQENRLQMNKVSVRPLPTSEFKGYPLNLINNIYWRIINDENILDKYREYCLQINAKNPEALLEVKKFSAVLVKFLPLLWKRVKQRVKDLASRSPQRNELMSDGELNESFLLKIKNQFFPMFFNQFLFIDDAPQYSQKNAFNLIFNEKLDDFMVEPIHAAREKVFENFSDDEREHLNAIQAAEKSKILYNRWKDLLMLRDDYGNTIFWAIQKNRTDIMSYIFESVFYYWRDLELLFEAAIFCNKGVEVLKRLFDHLILKPGMYEYFLSKALYCGNTTAVRFLHAAWKRNINDVLISGSDQIIPLHIACRNGDLEMIQCLHLDCGADLMQTHEGFSALYYAVENQHMRAAQYLMQNIKKNTPEEKTSFINCVGAKNIIDLAVKMGDLSMIELLKTALLEVDPKGNWNESFPKYEIQNLSRPLVTVKGQRYAARNISQQSSDSNFIPEQKTALVPVADLPPDQELIKALELCNKNRVAEILEDLDAITMTNWLENGFNYPLEKKDEKDSQATGKRGALDFIFCCSDLADYLDWNCYETTKYVLSKSTAPLKLKDYKGRTPLLYIVSKMLDCNFRESNFISRVLVMIKLFVKNKVKNILGNDFEEVIKLLYAEIKQRENLILAPEWRRWRDAQVELAHLKKVLESLQNKPESITLSDDEEAEAFSYINPEAEGLAYLDSLEKFIHEAERLHAQAHGNSFSKSILASSLATVFKQPAVISMPVQESKATLSTQESKPVQTETPSTTNISLSGLQESDNHSQPQATQTGPKR